MQTENTQDMDIWAAAAVLRERGVQFGEKGLRAYVREGLAPGPVTLTLGGRGRRAMYPGDLAAQAAASFALVSKYRIDKSTIARARQIALHCLERWIRLRQGYQSAGAMEADDELREIIGTHAVAAGLSSEWAAAYFDFSWTGADADAHYEGIVALAKEKGAEPHSPLAIEAENARYVLGWRGFFRVTMGLTAHHIALEAAIAKAEGAAGA